MRTERLIGFFSKRDSTHLFMSLVALKQFSCYRTQHILLMVHAARNDCLKQETKEMSAVFVSRPWRVFPNDISLLSDIFLSGLYWTDA